MLSVLKKKKKGCSGKDLQKKECFKSGMKERVGDEKLIIISVAVRGINDHIRFYSQMLCTALTRQEHRPVPVRHGTVLETIEGSKPHKPLSVRSTNEFNMIR